MGESSPIEVRRALIERLEVEGRTDLASRLAKCGQPLTLRCSSCTSARECFTRCDLKWCPSCQRAIAARTAARYSAIASACQWPLFVTWTVQHDKHDDVELIRTVRRAHTKLRRLRWWKRAVKGGVIAYEVAKDDWSRDTGWHPHGHSLIDAEWLSVTETKPKWGATREDWAKKGRRAAKELAEQWSLCLGRKGSVKVRRCWTDASGGIGGAVAEVLKYSVKGDDLIGAPLDVGPLIDVLDRTRLVASWGSFYRHPKLKRERSAPAMCQCGCTEWLPEDVLARQARGEHGW